MRRDLRVSRKFLVSYWKIDAKPSKPTISSSLWMRGEGNEQEGRGKLPQRIEEDQRGKYQGNTPYF